MQQTWKNHIMYNNTDPLVSSLGNAPANRTDVFPSTCCPVVSSGRFALWGFWTASIELSGTWIVLPSVSWTVIIFSASGILIFMCNALLIL